MANLKDEPMSEMETKEFLNQISEDVDELFDTKSKQTADIKLSADAAVIEEGISLEQSLEYLSLSIQNRLKVEVEEKKMPLNNSLFNQLSKYAFLVDAITQK